MVQLWCSAPRFMTVLGLNELGQFLADVAFADRLPIDEAVGGTLPSSWSPTMGLEHLVAVPTIPEGCPEGGYPGPPRCGPSCELSLCRAQCLGSPEPRIS